MIPLRKNILSNFIFLALGGLAGLGFYASIVFLDDLSFLGIFNQILAIHIVVSQIGTMGIQYALQQRLASAQSSDQLPSIFSSGMCAGLASSFVISLGLYLISPVLADFFQTPHFSVFLVATIPGFFAFNLNKLILGAMNGLHRMVLYGAIFGLRPILYFIFYLSMTLLPLSLSDAFRFGAIFCGTELILLVILVTKLDWHLLVTPTLLRMGEMVSFGCRSSLMGVFSELNTRVDVICIGFFMEDKFVGIYSFALAIYEGLMQILTILRNNMNPLLAKMMSGNKQALTELVHTMTRRVYPYALILWLILCLIIPVVPKLLYQSDVFIGYSAFVMLCFGLASTAGIFPFGAILLQANRPGLFSCITGLALAGNILLNIIFIPMFGIMGAALATSLSLILPHVFYFLIFDRLFDVNLMKAVWPFAGFKDLSKL